MVCTIEPNTRAGKRFSGRNQFWAERSHPLRIRAAAAASMTARDAYGLFSETKCCDIQPFRIACGLAQHAKWLDVAALGLRKQSISNCQHDRPGSALIGF